MSPFCVNWISCIFEGTEQHRSAGEVRGGCSTAWERRTSLIPTHGTSWNWHWWGKGLCVSLGKVCSVQTPQMWLCLNFEASLWRRWIPNSAEFLLCCCDLLQERCYSGLRMLCVVWGVVLTALALPGRIGLGCEQQWAGLHFEAVFQFLTKPGLCAGRAGLSPQGWQWGESLCSSVCSQDQKESLELGTEASMQLWNADF